MSTGVIAILGPTASGKSDVAMAVAERVGAEIVCCDSMVVYRGLDIGTAKPSATDRERVPHHLLDVVSMHERFDVHAYVEAAAAAIAAINGRGRPALLCGGTGMYAKALLYGFALRPHDPEVAAAVLADRERLGDDALRAELAELAPDVEVDTTNPRRLLRALEAARMGGADALRAAAAPPAGTRQFLLIPSPTVTRERVAMRTRAMLAAGWLDEVAALVADGLLETPTAAQALGYRDIGAYLSGASTEQAALEELLVTRTCQYAKRQRTWFRHQHPGGEVLDMRPAEAAAHIAASLAATRQ
jgi:tRNA dimethylallyltransferase